MMTAASPLAERIHRIENEIDAICLRSGRVRAEVQLIPVSKTVTPERILDAYAVGCRRFAENRVQELLSKKKELPGDIEWDLIGHLQTNKVKDIVGEVSLIQSLDRIELAEQIVKIAARKQIAKVECLVQINSSGETSKFGLPPFELKGFMERMKEFPVIVIKGLMTLGPLTDNQGLIRDAFRRTRDLFNEIKELFPAQPVSVLSMGMSGDYPIAIEEGATLVRLGTVIFGTRASK